ncbi:L-serine dehydratase, beta chain SdhB [Gottschalkia purinilytica]|uniref:L-serine deaminase n=1 Tax=Gottschalkia purinilytica TaxID=1503 RepID=A0A0L0WFI4_GOTPU|nr:L-serine ammonia-lyase, iron-sulfur-dependent subunit beta [Gottschalkia purinilytica]KNF10191.1 L-serine dehydratase, beta chain SdhB [Gottschalkia purinilytica]
MKQYGVFDILGPIMIGPSSSHTAGAARLGKVARSIAGKDFKSVKFYLHGSFAKTYRGHGTDRALVAGILGMDPEDERLRTSLDIAKQESIGIEFIESDLGESQHPNTVKMVFAKNDGSVIDVTGSSIGGGSIVITNIEGNDVSLTGNCPTIIVKYRDKKGVVSKVTNVLSENNINIGIMKVDRTPEGEATMIIEVDNIIPENVPGEVSKIEEVISARAINPIG